MIRMTMCVLALIGCLPLWAQLDFYYEAGTDPSLWAFPQGTTIIFWAQDSSGTFLDYRWDFGDGTTTAGDEVSHTYTLSGVYEVSVTPYVDDQVAGRTWQRFLFINPLDGDPNVAPGILAPDDNSIFPAGQAIDFTGVAAGSAPSFYWRLNDSPQTFRGAQVTWQPTMGDVGYHLMFMNAVNDDGFADPYGAVRTLYVHGENVPPDAYFTTPAPADVIDDFFRMDLGETVTFQLAADDPDGPLPLTFGFELYDPDGGAEIRDGSTWTWTPDQGGVYLLCSRATDGDGEADPFSPCLNILVKAENTEPFAYITDGSQTFAIGEAFTLYAEGDDPEGDPLTYHWDLGDGRTREGQEIVLSYETAGVNRVTLQAADDSGGLSAPFQRWIFINDYTANPANQSPQGAIVAPGNGAAFPAMTAIRFEGFGSDDQETPLTYYWDFSDGTLAEGPVIEKAYGEPCVSFGDLCAFGVQLFVRDALGRANEYGDDLRLVIYDDQPPPDGVILAPDLAPPADEPFVFEQPVVTLRPGQSLSLRGGVRDVTDLSGYDGYWQFETSGASFQVAGIEPAPITYDRFDQPGDWNVYWHPQDPSGLHDPVPASFRLRVRAANEPPQNVTILEPSYDRPIARDAGLDLAAGGIDEDGDAVIFRWTIRAVASQVPPRTLTGERIDFVSFAAPGLYEITLTAEDSQGAVTEAPRKRYVVVYPATDDPQADNRPPDIEPITPSGRILIPVDGNLNFTTHAEDPDGDTVDAYFWNFGNGQTASGAQPGPVAYMEPGFYDVTVYARDNRGLWSRYPAYWGIYVFGTNIPPVSEITTPPLTASDDDYLQRLIPVLPDTELVFEGRGMDRDGHEPLTPIWYVGEAPCIECSGFATPPLRFEEIGNHDVSLYVTDSEGLSDPFGDVRVVKVIDPEKKPETYIIEPAGDLTVEPGEAVYFYGFGEDPNDLPVTVTWDIPGARQQGPITGEEVYPVYFDEPSPPGEPYVVTLRATTEFTEDETPATVRIRVRAFADEEFEPNNDPSNAVELAAGRYGNLQLGPDDPNDSFAFDVTEAGKDLRLAFTPAEDGALARLRLYRDTGNGFDAVSAADLDEGGGLSLENVPPGRYVVEAALTEAGLKRRMSLGYALTVTTLEPALFLPFMVEDGNLRSSLGIINTTEAEADLAVAGLDQFGRTVITRSLELPPRGRIFVTGVSFFGSANNQDRARDIRWVKILSTRRLVGYTNGVTLDGSQLMSVGAVRSLSASMLVPHIAADTAQWYTRAVVVNVDEADSPLTFLSNNGPLTLDENLQANHQKDFRFGNLFAESLPGWGELRNRGNRDTLAGFELFGRVDGRREIAALELVDVRQRNPNFVSQAGNLFFSHVAQDIANWWTGLALINTTDGDVTYNLVGFDDAGAELARLNGQLLPPGGKLLNVTTTLFPDVNVSWVKVESDGGLAGFELFGDHAATRLSGFQAARSLTDTLYFPHLQVRNGLWTGIAILSASTEPMDITLTAYDDAGQVQAQTTVNLPPQTKWVRLAESIFPDGLPATASYLRVTAPIRAITGFELFGSLPAAGLADDQFAGLNALRE